MRVAASTEADPFELRVKLGRLLHAAKTPQNLKAAFVLCSRNGALAAELVDCVVEVLREVLPSGSSSIAGSQRSKGSDFPCRVAV